LLKAFGQKRCIGKGHLNITLSIKSVMTWTHLLSSLDRSQRENDSALILDSLRHILSRLALADGTNSLIFDDNSKAEVETLFAASSKLLAFKHPLVRKLAGWILLIIGNNDHFEDRELYLLAVNSLIANGTANPDYLTRGKALTVCWQLGRNQSLTDHQLEVPDLKETAVKDCEYVRRLAVLFAFDLGDADADRLEKLIKTDSDPVVIVNAFVVLAGINNGDARLSKDLILHAMSQLITFSEPSKASFIAVLSELTSGCDIDWTDDDSIVLLNHLDGCLDGSSAANLILASAFLLQTVDSSSLLSKNELRSQILDRVLPSLWKQLDKGPEVAHQVLDFLLSEVSKTPNLVGLLTQDGIEWCHISPRDPVFLVLKKVEILVKLATTNRESQQNSTILHAILSQLFTWTTASHNSTIVESALVAVTQIRSLSMRSLLENSHRLDVVGKCESPAEASGKDDSQAVFRRCMNHVLGLLDQPSPIIVASALCALKEALEDFDEFSVDVAKDAIEDDPLEDEASQSKTYLYQLMSKIPGCIVVLQKAKRGLRDRALSAVLFFVEKYSWALHPSTSSAYILEDLYLKHFVKDPVALYKSRDDRTSSKLKIELLSTAMKIFVQRPNETLPLLKEMIARFDLDQDVFLSLKSHRLFGLSDSFCN